MEPEFWSAIREIAAREGLTIKSILEEIDETRGIYSRTSACAVYILLYFKTAATEPGHTTAGHGPLPERFG